MTAHAVARAKEELRVDMVVHLCAENTPVGGERERGGGGAFFEREELVLRAGCKLHEHHIIDTE